MTHSSHPSYPETVPTEGAPRQTPVPPKHGGGVQTGAVNRPKGVHYDPAGNPIEFTDSSVRDQQVGGDMSGRTAETRDDNFIDDADGANLNRQLQRDMGTGLDNFDSASKPGKRASPAVEPDGSEDPLAGIDKA
jgi:hypothetical protein